MTNQTRGQWHRLCDEWKKKLKVMLVNMEAEIVKGVEVKNLWVYNSRFRSVHIPIRLIVVHTSLRIHSTSHEELSHALSLPSFVSTDVFLQGWLWLLTLGNCISLGNFLITRLEQRYRGNGSFERTQNLLFTEPSLQLWSLWSPFLYFCFFFFSFIIFHLALPHATIPYCLFSDLFLGY